MNLATWVERHAREQPNSPAVAHGEDVHATWSGFARTVAAVGAGLCEVHGLAPGDRVAIVMTNRPEYLETMFGAWHAGLVAVPVNARLHRDEIAYIIEHSGTAVVVTDDEHAEDVATLVDDVPTLRGVVVAPGAQWDALVASPPAPIVERGPDDPAWLFYTSGTTGRPKGATLTNRNLLMMSLSYFADIDPVSSSDAVLHAAPISHGSGLYGLPHVARGAVSVIPRSGGVDGAEIAALIRRWPGLSFFAAPTMVKRLASDPAVAGSDLTNLKTIIYGGAPMYLADLEEALEVFGPRLAQIYGQGETPMTITALSKAHHADTLAPATAETVRDGWLYTGDVGSFDDDGCLTLRDRSKDLIISGGMNIYPREVEEVLLLHPSVKEVSVVGRPDAEWGESVVAFVVTHDGVALPSTGELDTLCIERIARYKRPKEYRFVVSLPTNNYGKVMKRELRERLQAE